jgi:hypothetical protein
MPVLRVHKEEEFMKRRRIFLLTGLVCAAVLIGVVGVAAVGGYTLDWWTVDGGGGVSSGGDYSLGGSIGQPDAGNSSGGPYALVGGFWGGADGSNITHTIFLPLIFK